MVRYRLFLVPYARFAIRGNERRVVNFSDAVTQLPEFEPGVRSR
jgi:hypothetical protein